LILVCGGGGVGVGFGGEGGWGCVGGRERERGGGGDNVFQQTVKCGNTMHNLDLLDIIQCGAYCHTYFKMFLPHPYREQINACQLNILDSTHHIVAKLRGDQTSAGHVGSCETLISTLSFCLLNIAYPQGHSISKS